ncbi:hypothetical protein HY029_03635 [Candidatus Gottesmanbacteria bacterium]|nr:hypothetical protein [Candidatus Gottesmanbacteria bacterium]
MNLFVFAVFIIWRVWLFFVAAVGEKILAFTPRFPYSDVYFIPSHLPSWLWGFANFDGVHYLTIAKFGYSAQFTQVFFPLYPMMVGFINQLLQKVNPVIIGLLISNLLFFLSLLILTKLLSLDYKVDTIKWILLFLIFFPTSFFFGSLYTESLFLFLILTAFYAARKNQWLAASIFGVLASSTKFIGIFLLPALLWEWQEQKRKKITTIFRSPLSLIPVGLLSYMLYLQVKFGDWLYFWHAQPVFGAQRSGGGVILIPQVLWRYMKILTSVSYKTEAFWIPLLELISTLGVITLLIMAFKKKIRSSYLVFSFLTIITPTFTGTFSSMPRYILVAFPIFIVLGMLKSRLIKGIFLAIFSVLLLVLTILFTRGHWVS